MKKMAILTFVLLLCIGCGKSEYEKAQEKVDNSLEEARKELKKELLNFLAYLHLNEPNWAGGDITFPDGFREQMRERFSGSLIYCGNYDAERAEARIGENTTDAVAFGRPYIANPDLPERFRVDAPLTEPNHETFYGGDEKGYTDYPFMDNGYDRMS